MENIEVENVIISKQFEDSNNLKEFLNIVAERNIKIMLVEAGDRLNIEKNLYFNILWPDNSEFISENGLNNNSIVCKLVYKNFSTLFTGDIEEIAEKQIVSKYTNSKILNSTILKVAHHGSKTSSIQEFLKMVNPKIVLIGVGKNNLFGHPNKDVIERLQNLRCYSL